MDLFNGRRLASLTGLAGVTRAMTCPVGSTHRGSRMRIVESLKRLAFIAERRELAVR